MHYARRGRTLIALPLLYAASLAIPLAMAQGAPATYPSKPVRLIVGFPAGGPVDTLGRVLGKQLAQAFGQPVVVDNRASANGIMGTDAVTKAAPDGYTLLMGASTMSIQATLVPKLRYDVLRDLTPIAGVASAPLMLVVNPSVPADQFGDFIRREIVKWAKVIKACGAKID